MSLNLIIPCAGMGTRFLQANYSLPKFLLEPLSHKTMIELVIENVTNGITQELENVYILAQEEHIKKFSLKEFFARVSESLFFNPTKITLLPVKGITDGAAATLLLAKEYINNETALFIANSDQYISDFKPNDFIKNVSNYNGGILTFLANSPKWSFAQVNKDDLIERVAEKVPISRFATTGNYWWSKGSDFVKYAQQMMNKNIRVNGEFYLCPTFNEAIQGGKQIKNYTVPKESMHCLGTPEDFQRFVMYNMVNRVVE